MIRRTRLLDDFERDQIAKSSREVSVNSRVFDALYREAVNLGMLPPRDRLEGIDVHVRIAQFLNRRPPARKDRDGA
jgi:hypothetical protein